MTDTGPADPAAPDRPTAPDAHDGLSGLTAPDAPDRLAGPTASATTPDRTPAAPARRPRRAWRAATAVAVALLLLAAAFWGWSVLADQRYAAARADHAQAVENQDDAWSALGARLRSVHNNLVRAHSVTATAEFASEPLPEADPLVARTADLDALEAEVQNTYGTDGPSAPDLPEPDGWQPPWAVLGAADDAEQSTDTLQATAADLTGIAVDAATADTALDDASTAYFAAVAAHADATVAASPLAAKRTTVALTRYLEQARDPAQSAAHTGPLLTELEAAEREVAASQQTIAAQQSDPAWAVRNEIEAYARSISHGVTLDFDWSAEVSGKGEGWYSGTAETYDSDGGWSIISLNYPVENDWYSDPNPRALVTHEVGHTQIYRDDCRALFTGPVFDGDQETWATAWAIAQGFDLPGSGIEAYGRPTDEQIATAAQCD